MKAEVLGPIREVYGAEALQLRENSAQERVISTDTVYQQANVRNRDLINSILKQLTLPGSGILGLKHLDELYRRALNGESCLILMEHYSNFDIPCLFYLLTKADRTELAESIIAIAGMKLNEDSPFVVAFAEAYTRIVIYPSRSLTKLADDQAGDREIRRGREINMAATRQMIRQKHQGKIILLFPSGTRYRENDPDTKRGVKEVDSYIKAFDWMVSIGIAGNVLRIDPDGDMSRDLAARDTVLLSVSEIARCDEFRDQARTDCPDSADQKQHVADKAMITLETEHNKAAETRAKSMS